jgi:hypothetical protein
MSWHALDGAITDKQEKKENGEGWTLSGRSGGDCRRDATGRAGKRKGGLAGWPGMARRTRAAGRPWLRQRRVDRGNGSVGRAVTDEQQ